MKRGNIHKRQYEIKLLFLLISILFLFRSTFANEDIFPFGVPKIDLTDHARLQRGARDYMNYCSGCHSLQYLRYKQLAIGLGITDNQKQVASKILQQNLMFTGEKVTDHINRSVKKDDVKQWLGVEPPDLTLEYNAKGGKWLYNYLLGFYVDKKRPWGVNNIVYKDVAMPNVLGDLQGVWKAVYRINLIDGSKKEVVNLKSVEQGQLTQAENKKLVNDLVNFLAFVSQPNKVARIQIGLYVILFLVVLIIIAWALKREYWKDIKKTNEDK